MLVPERGPLKERLIKAGSSVYRAEHIKKVIAAFATAVGMKKRKADERNQVRHHK